MNCIDGRSIEIFPKFIGIVDRTVADAVKTVLQFRLGDVGIRITHYKDGAVGFDAGKMDPDGDLHPTLWTTVQQEAIADLVAALSPTTYTAPDHPTEHEFELTVHERVDLLERDTAVLARMVWNIGNNTGNVTSGRQAGKVAQSIEERIDS